MLRRVVLSRSFIASVSGSLYDCIDGLRGYPGRILRVKWLSDAVPMLGRNQCRLRGSEPGRWQDQRSREAINSHHREADKRNDIYAMDRLPVFSSRDILAGNSR